MTDWTLMDRFSRFTDCRLRLRTILNLTYMFYLHDVLVPLSCACVRVAAMYTCIVFPDFLSPCIIFTALHLMS